MLASFYDVKTTITLKIENNYIFVILMTQNVKKNVEMYNHMSGMTTVSV